jgi:hypothetical protein
MEAKINPSPALSRKAYPIMITSMDYWGNLRKSTDVHAAFPSSGPLGQVVEGYNLVVFKEGTGEDPQEMSLAL